MPYTLQMARRLAGLTISELARRAGVDRATIHRLETGASRPAFDTVVALEQALGLPTGGLTFGEREPGPLPAGIPSPAGERRGAKLDRRKGGRRRANREQQPDRRKGSR